MVEFCNIAKTISKVRSNYELWQSTARVFIRYFMRQFSADDFHNVKRSNFGKSKLKTFAGND